MHVIWQTFVSLLYKLAQVNSHPAPTPLAIFVIIFNHLITGNCVYDSIRIEGILKFLTIELTLPKFDGKQLVTIQ